MPTLFQLSASQSAQASSGLCSPGELHTGEVFPDPVTALSPSAESHDCVWTRQLQKGHVKAHQAEAWGTQSKAEALYGQCVWSRPAFLGGEAERRAALPQELS